MSPEQVRRGATVDARSDVFSLGVTLYECLTLELPFDGVSTDQVLHRIVHSDPVDPRRLHPGLPVDLAAIALMALEKDPSQRYQTAGALADDLRAFLELRPVQARPPTAFTRLRRWARREPLQAGFAAVVFVAVGLGGTLLARLPDIQAAAKTHAQQDFENEIVAGMVARTGKDRSVAYGHCRRALALAPGNVEALSGLCTSILQYEGAGAAIAEFERLAGKSSPDADVERLRALLLLKLGKGTEAKALLERLGEPHTATALALTAAVMADDPKDVPAINKAAALMSLSVRVSAQPRLMRNLQWAGIVAMTQNLAARKEAADTLLALWPDSAQALHYAGTDLILVDPQRSAELLQKALALGLVDPICELNLAIALQKLGRKDEAVRRAHRALADPSLFDRGREMGIELLQQLDDFKGAETEAERWLASEPDNVVAMRLLGETSSNADDGPRAVEVLRKLADRAPKDVAAQYNLAVALDSASNLVAATDQLRVVLALDPAHERAHRRLMGVLGDRKDAPAILAELERWNVVRADDAKAAGDLATVLLLVDDDPAAPAKALAAAERADYLTGGKDAAALELHARALERLGDKIGAARCRDRAHASKPGGAK
jgi:tetratricopeptide (TPR) repeat protein